MNMFLGLLLVSVFFMILLTFWTYFKLLSLKETEKQQQKEIVVEVEKKELERQIKEKDGSCWDFEKEVEKLKSLVADNDDPEGAERIAREYRRLIQKRKEHRNEKK